MANQLEEEIRSLSNEQLEDYIETFRDRIEYTKDYLNDCDDFDVRMVMQGKLREFSYKFNLMVEEKRRRSSSNGTNNSVVQGNPARPAGVKITRDKQITTYQVYIKCPIFLEKIPIINNPIYRRDLANDLFGRRGLLCKDDCLFPTCPFYDRWTIDNRIIDHPDDYDEWVVQAYENFNK